MKQTKTDGPGSTTGPLVKEGANKIFRNAFLADVAVVMEKHGVVGLSVTQSGKNTIYKTDSEGLRLFFKNVLANFSPDSFWAETRPTSDVIRKFRKEADSE